MSSIIKHQAHLQQNMIQYRPIPGQNWTELKLQARPAESAEQAVTQLAIANIAYIRRCLQFRNVPADARVVEARMRQCGRHAALNRRLGSRMAEATPTVRSRSVGWMTRHGMAVGERRNAGEHGGQRGQYSCRRRRRAQRVAYSRIFSILY